MTYVKQLLRDSCCETVDKLQRKMKNRRGSSIRKFFPKTVADVRPGVRVTVREKDLYLKFPSTSGCGKVLPRILGDPAITWHPKFLLQKNFFIRFLAINFSLAIHNNSRVNIRYSRSKISVFRGLASINIQTQIPKFSSLRSANLEFSRIRQFPFNFEVNFKSSYSSSLVF